MCTRDMLSKLGFEWKIGIMHVSFVVETFVAVRMCSDDKMFKSIMLDFDFEKKMIRFLFCVTSLDEMFEQVCPVFVSCACKQMFSRAGA